MDIISSKDTIGFIIRDLNINCVLLIQLKDSTARHLVQEPFVVLIICEHNWLTIFVQCHQGIGPVDMHVIGKIVDSRDVACKNAARWVIVLLCIVHNLVKANGFS